MNNIDSSSSDSDSDELSPNPKRLKTLAYEVQTSEGNLLLHQFVLDHSPPDEIVNEPYINAVLVSMIGVSVNDYNEEGYTALHLAVINSNLFMVKKLLLYLKDIDVNLECKFFREKNALHFAIEFSNLKIAKELLRYGASVNKKDGLGYTPLSLARYDADMIKLLLENGADINALSYGGKTVLYQALRNVLYRQNFSCSKESDRSDIIKMLLKAGADVTIAYGEYKYTALHFTAQFGTYNATKLLLESDANVNALDSLKYTPLHYAAGLNDKATNELLLENGADVNAEDHKSCAPIHYAAEAGSLEVVQLFLDRGADVNSKNKYGFTPIHRSAKRETTGFMRRLYRSSCGIDVLKFLLEKGADVHAVDTSSCTALHYAVKSGDLDMVSLLIEKGAHVSAQNIDGYSPLHCAVEVDNIDIVKLLLQRGADVDMKNKDNKTPIDLAENNLQSCVACVLYKLLNTYK